MYLKFKQNKKYKISLKKRKLQLMINIGKRIWMTNFADWFLWYEFKMLVRRNNIKQNNISINLNTNKSKVKDKKQWRMLI